MPDPLENFLPERELFKPDLISIGDRVAERNAFSWCLAATRAANACRKKAVRHGAQGRNRTTDTAIFSRMLYQLSYLGPAGHPRPHG